MEIELDPSKTVEENAAAFYEQAKKLKRKREGLLAAIEDTKKKLASHANKLKYAAAERDKKVVRLAPARQRKWFEKFQHFTTSGGRLCLAGREAKQNELLVARHLEPSDLFFHADVHGAAAVVLKDGQAASEQEKREAAQFAACYSSAWKAEFAVCDVFAAKPEQVSKHSHGEFVPKGGFMISGKKEYFRGVPLRMWAGVHEGALAVLPGDFDFSQHPLPKKAALAPGNTSKSEAAKKLASSLGLEGIAGILDELVRTLPGSVRL